jgi:Fe-S-cluster containining protein
MHVIMALRPMNSKYSVQLQNPKSWIKFKQEMCDTCVGSCCQLAVEAKLSDLIRMNLVDSFEAEEPIKKIVKRLKKEGHIRLYNNKSELFILEQRPNGDCLFLHPLKRNCIIYDIRPDTCRDHPKIGPRPGFCAYKKRDQN